MFNSLMMLALEANGVVAQRMMKLMRGGRRARSEAKLMVSEKVDAAYDAAARLMAGASGEENSTSVSPACSGECQTAGQTEFRPEPKACS